MMITQPLHSFKGTVIKKSKGCRIPVSIKNSFTRKYKRVKDETGFTYLLFSGSLKIENDRIRKNLKILFKSCLKVGQYLRKLIFHLFISKLKYTCFNLNFIQIKHTYLLVEFRHISWWYNLVSGIWNFIVICRYYVAIRKKIIFS